MKTLSKFYPKSIPQIVHQNGAILAESVVPGVEVNLFFKDAASFPHAAELIGEDEDYYAEIGLTFEGALLVDYDGVFDLPHEVKDFLREQGADLSGIC